ncbi:hypothetical protein [Chryseosolibacter indicus]|uniref:Glycosyl hydrolase family 65 n=1 Tax=Chryseosolibacter indicus TaxID=2782351 RepID=A0ABS5VXU4_9BACT|nr:hypothetical protein [Chryseosolibacter indicus]MBT1706217.1 hypothetical protein [Chryseosolibacter indicus]
MCYSHLFIVLTFLFYGTTGIIYAQGKLHRKSIVKRHEIKVNKTDTLASLTVGNGRFAFTADVTGMQTFATDYKNGVPLGTQAEWGWHSFPNTEKFREEEALQEFDLEGKKLLYSVIRREPDRNRDASNYFRVNQHRLQLGNIGLDIEKKDGTQLTLSDIKYVNQSLDLWRGELVSRFKVEGTPVTVITYAHQKSDAVSFKIISRFIKQGKIKIRLRFPYPTAEFKDEGANYTNHDKHETVILHSSEREGTLKHTLDTTTYYIHAAWNGSASLKEQSSHYFTITPGQSNTFELTVLFSKSSKVKSISSFEETRASSQKDWEGFWQSGGAVDFSGSTDKRAHELERRVVLSQYLTKVQCAGNFPPQETGLTFNSWYGKSHIEMFWWHAAHFALWNRTELLEKSMEWYFSAASQARRIAERQGFDGVRWQKMTDNEGREVPSSIGSFLVWQQPHFIYLAELIYRNKKDKGTLEKYKGLLFETADFMASFPTYDSTHNRYNLGKGLIPAQECFNALDTFNPTYELAYWHWALNTAQQWRKRLGMDRKREWDEVLSKLAPLPQKNGVYLATESTPDCYDDDSKYLIDHPAVLAALSAIPPSNNLDTATMSRTYNLVEKAWNWDHTWGWDFPMIAMTATRLQKPSLALNGLFKEVTTNTYLRNGHNYQDKRLTIYLPGNGGILAAIAIMCAGYDGATTRNPGFPNDGTWKIKWENLNKFP